MGAVQFFDCMVLFDNLLHALGCVSVVAQSLVEVIVYLVECKGRAVNSGGRYFVLEGL